MFCNSITAKTKYTSSILLFGLGLCLLYSCKKDPPKEKDQEVKASVVDAAGNTVLFNATGPTADMGRYYGSPSIFSISAINERNAYLIIQFDPAIANTPGTYPLSECQYRVERNTGTIYFNSSQNGPGTITIKTLTDTFIEGSFSLMCILTGTVTDSVTITGTFKGEYEN